MKKIRRVAIVFDNLKRPDTTGVYCRRALSQIISCDHFLPTELPLVRPEDYDLFLYIDDSLTRTFSPKHRPSAWWAIDTHLDGETYRRLGPDVDFVFCAQLTGAKDLERHGIKASWLPLALDPEMHRPDQSSEKLYDFCFVGNIFPGARERLLKRLMTEFSSHFVGRKYFQEMANTYARSRIVFNCSIAGDLNMRVFEALASGSLLITDRTADKGLSQLFTDGEHLLTYGSEPELIQKCQWALEHPDKRERIASTGRGVALAGHTYRHRMEQILAEIERVADDPTKMTELQQPRIKDSTYFDHPRRDVLEIIPESARSVLDIGCAGGRLGAAVRSRQGARVVGVERDPVAVAAARMRLDQVIEANLEDDGLEFNAAEFDCVVCADILEHLREPQKLLKRIWNWLTPDGTLVVSLPNVRHYSVIKSLLYGNWTYESAGLLDEDHVRFYTRREMEKLLYRASFEEDSLRCVHGPGFSGWNEQGRSLNVCFGGITYHARDQADAEELFTNQFLVRSRKRQRADFGLTSIILLTHGQLAFTRLCLESVRRFTDERYELIVVDNASPDGTVEYLKAQPDVRLICNSTNRGFPAAVNQGMQVAQGQQILLLNNDTIVTTGWLQRMLNALYSSENIGLVGPVSNSVSGPQFVATDYEDLMQLDGFAWDWGRRHHAERVPISRIVGFCMLMKRELVDRIGMLDERFGLGNFEDDDYSRRALAAGYTNIIAYDSFVHHFGGRTFQGSGINHAELLQENASKYREKWSRTNESPRESGTLGGVCEIANRPLLSLCMIVRNNEATIVPCLESIRPWVDEMIVVDTGSTDRTVEICRDLGAKVSFFTWCDDFSAARNHSLERAAGSWIFWMDSDDVITAENGRKLRNIAQQAGESGPSGYVMQVHCPGQDEQDVTVVDHVKLFRNDPKFRFEFRIHEQILLAIRRAGGHIDFTDVFVTHAGADRSPAGKERKLKRDLRILQKDLEHNPDHPFILFNLGMTYTDARRHEEAIIALNRCIAISGPDESHLAKAFSLLVGCHIDLGRNEAAWEACERGLARFPDDVELRFRAASLHHQAKRLREAARDYVSLLEGDRVRRFCSVDRGLTGFKARHNLAIVYEELEEWGLAETQWRRIIADLPGYRSAWRGLGDVLLKSGNLSEVDELIRTMRAHRHAELLLEDSIVLAARLAEGRNMPESARDILESHYRSIPQAVLVLRELCRVVFERFNPRDAITYLEALAEQMPNDPATLHNLGVAYMAAKEQAKATRALRHALELRPEARHTRDALESLTSGTRE